MRITLENTTNFLPIKRKCIIEIDTDELDIGQMWEELIRPLLLAAGYAEKTVDELE